MGGWIINTDKSRLVPQQSFEWLGIHYDLENYKIKNTDQLSILPFSNTGNCRSGLVHETQTYEHTGGRELDGGNSL